MDKDIVLTKLQRIFDFLFLEPVVVSSSLSARDIAEWDSLMQISIVVSVEKEFKIKFKLGEVEATNNLGEFADLIISKTEVLVTNEG